MLRKKERDFEVTMEHLQADIDQLEGEKGELRDKIKDITKQTLFKQINEKMMMTSGGGSGGGGGAGPTSMGPSSIAVGVRVRKGGETVLFLAC